MHALVTGDGKLDNTYDNTYNQSDENNLQYYSYSDMDLFEKLVQITPN